VVSFIIDLQNYAPNPSAVNNDAVGLAIGRVNTMLDGFARDDLTVKIAVFLFHTFSKTISPSLRIGYMVLPKHLVKTYEEKLGFYSCTIPTFMQYVLTELIDNGDFERHINRVRRGLRKQNK